MKANIFAVAALALVFIVGCTSRQSEEFTQQRRDQIRSEVKAVGDSLIARWARLDADGAMQYYAPEVAVYVDSVRLDFQTLKRVWKGKNDSTATMRVSPYRTDYLVLTKDVVILNWVGKEEESLKSGDSVTTDPIALTVVFRNIAGQWKAFYQRVSGVEVTQKAAGAHRPRR